MQTSQLPSLRISLFSSVSSVFAGDEYCIQTEGIVVNQIVERISVWSASLMDKPGGLSNILNCLDEAGVDLDFIIARRAPEEPGTGIVFVSPLEGDREVRAARSRRSSRALGRARAPAPGRHRRCTRPAPRGTLAGRRARCREPDPPAPGQTRAGPPRRPRAPRGRSSPGR